HLSTHFPYTTLFRSENTPPVVIINTEAAHEFWPGQDPIGKRIGVNYTDAAPRLREIVGIVGNIRHDALDAPAAPAVYLPYLQDEDRKSTRLNSSHVS